MAGLRTLKGLFSKRGKCQEEKKENKILPDERSLLCPPGKSMIFFKKANRIKLGFWPDLADSIFPQC